MALSFDASEGELLTIDSQRSLPAPFLTKTYQLVDDPSSSHIVSWGEDGTTFIVWRPAEFARDLLPNYFKHNNFSSFVRQLNTYGFRKIVPDRWEFANEFFRKGEKHLLSDIHRRKASQQACTSRSSPTLSLEEQQAWPSLSSSHNSSQAAIDFHHALIALSDENERLRRDNTMLSCELSRLKKLYSDVVMFIQQHAGLPYQDACRFRRMVGQSRAGSVAPHTLLQLEGNHVKHNSGIEEAVNQSSFCISFAFPQCNEGPISCIDDDKERDLTTQTSSGVTVIEDDKALPKLFGVPLQGKKRLHPESDADDGTPTRRAKFISDKLESINSSTNLKMDLALELRPSPLKAPWLKLCS